MARAVRSGTRADTIMVVVCALLAIVLIASPAGVRDAVTSAMRRTVLAPLVVLQQRAEKSRTAFLAQDRLTMQRDSVALRALSVPALEAENDRLRRLLGLAGRLDWGFVPAEALQGRGVGEEYALTLTAGSRAGVAPFSPVVAPEGLVGMIQSVDPTMSLAILWSHPDFRASAMSADGAAFGIAAAHLGATGPERYLLELRGVPFRSELKPGAIIVTSGLGGVYPRGIPIGTVVSETRTAEGWARTYLLRPALLPSDVGSVMVLSPRRAAAGVENVWQLASTMDTAVARIASAGDSVSRALVAQEAAARAAQLDSIRRAAVDSALRARGASTPPSGVAPLSPPPPPPSGGVRAQGTQPNREPVRNPPPQGEAGQVFPVAPRPNADSAAAAARARREAAAARARRDSAAARARRDSAANAAPAAPVTPAPTPTTPVPRDTSATVPPAGAPR